MLKTDSILGLIEGKILFLARLDRFCCFKRDDHPELEEPLVLEELYAALQGMDGGKAPTVFLWSFIRPSGMNLAEILWMFSVKVLKI